MIGFVVFVAGDKKVQPNSSEKKLKQKTLLLRCGVYEAKQDVFS